MFFSATELIYSIFNEINERPISIMSMDQEIHYNFETYLDFLNWMYKIWQDKIHYFHKEYGAFIISPSLYYKTYRKLRKKYYRKI